MDDDLPPVTWIGDIPGFGLDQYTRPGLAAIRRFAYSNRPWREFAEGWQIDRSKWPKAAGELLFRAEGAVVTARRTWAVGSNLFTRSSFVECYMPQVAVHAGMALIRREIPDIDRFRVSVLGER